MEETERCVEPMPTRLKVNRDRASLESNNLTDIINIYLYATTGPYWGGAPWAKPSELGIYFETTTPWPSKSYKNFCLHSSQRKSDNLC